MSSYLSFQQSDISFLTIKLEVLTDLYRKLDCILTKVNKSKNCELMTVTHSNSNHTKDIPTTVEVWCKGMNTSETVVGLNIRM